MKTGWSTFTPPAPRRRGLPGNIAPFFATVASTVAVIVLLIAFVPSPLVLPLFGTTSIALAFSVALFSLWRPRANAGDGVTWWDAAGALALIGFAAVLLSRPEEVLPLLAH